MAVQPQKEKIPLNRISHAVRASQAVLQYGVGAMIDFPDQTLMTAAPEYWRSQVVHIHDERFEKALGVNYFGMPGGCDQKQFSDGMSYVRFPEWYFCPKCRLFQPISEWVKEYRKKSKSDQIEKDPYMVNPSHMRCSTCHQDLVVARIVTCCEDGHISDFPWVEWVHKRNKSNAGSTDICGNPKLEIKTGASASEGLEGLVLTCKTCGATTTLRDAFNKDIFEDMDKKSSSKIFRCRGLHPHKHFQCSCRLYPKAMQRGSSSVYFPVTLSSLVIPPFASQLTVKIEQSSEFEKCVDRIEDTDEEDRDAKIKKKLNDWAASIAMEISAPVAKVVEILRRKWLGGPGAEMDTTSMEYRAEEYDALNGSAQGSGRTGDFSRESMTIDEYNLPYLVGISIINKIREVRTLVGFTRVNPGAGKDDPHFVSIKEPETRWYPAYEVRGEGIFIEFSNLLIQQWIAANPQVVERAHTLSVNWSESFIGKSRPRNISAKFLLLHTVAHLLIKQLSFECGYSIASLRERIYCGDEADGKVMSGIFIYTASGDSEGTLGGLVRQGRPDCFGRIFQKAIDSARICSNDPVCILSRGQGRESLNISACHACTLIPETSCEEYNVLLDRGLVVGTFDDPNFGFFQFDFGRHAAEDTKPRAAAVQLVDGEPLVDDYSTWEDYRKSDARLLASSELSRFGEMHVPLADQYDAELRVDGNTVTAFLVWEEHKIVITDGREKPFLRKLAEQSGWTCIPLDDIRATDIIQRVGGANYWQE